MVFLEGAVYIRAQSLARLIPVLEAGGWTGNGVCDHQYSIRYKLSPHMTDPGS